MYGNRTDFLFITDRDPCLTKESKTPYTQYKQTDRLFTALFIYPAEQYHLKRKDHLKMKDYLLTTVLQTCFLCLFFLMLFLFTMELDCV